MHTSFLLNGHITFFVAVFVVIMKNTPEFKSENRLIPGHSQLTGTHSRFLLKKS
jgi:hypothetical protein